MGRGVKNVIFDTFFYLLNKADEFSNQLKKPSWKLIFLFSSHKIIL